MSIMKWDPLKDLFYMEKHIDKIIASSFKQAESNFMPYVDVIENEEYIILIAELAGINESDMEVTISDGILTISGIKSSSMDIYQEDEYYYKIERPYGKFLRSFALPANVNTEVIKASLKDGLLKIVLTKTNKSNSKTIKIVSNDK